MKDRLKERVRQAKDWTKANADFVIPAAISLLVIAVAVKPVKRVIDDQKATNELCAAAMAAGKTIVIHGDDALLYAVDPDALTPIR